MSQAKVDRYKEEKKNRKKSWQKKKESVSLSCFGSLPLFWESD